VLDAERKVWGFKQFAPLAEARNPRSGFIGQEGLLTLQARATPCIPIAPTLQQSSGTMRVSVMSHLNVKILRACSTHWSDQLAIDN
jgi:hypothetical protein